MCRTLQFRGRQSTAEAVENSSRCSLHSEHFRARLEWHRKPLCRWDRLCTRRRSAMGDGGHRRRYHPRGKLCFIDTGTLVYVTRFAGVEGRHRFIARLRQTLVRLLKECSCAEPSYCLPLLCSSWHRCSIYTLPAWRG